MGLFTHFLCQIEVMNEQERTTLIESPQGKDGSDREQTTRQVQTQTYTPTDTCAHTHTLSLPSLRFTYTHIDTTKIIFGIIK